MSQKEIARHPTSDLAITTDQKFWTEKQEAALRQLGVDRATNAELAVFFHQCTRTGLDPFARQIYMIEREGKQTIQTGIDGFRLIARRAVDRSGETLGYEDALWCGPDGKWVDVWLASETPAAAKVTVLRNGARYPAVALYDEYVARKRNGDVNRMWQTKAALMLAKCAEALALRKAFPHDLSGIYTSDEMQSTQPAPPAEATPVESSATTETPTGDVHDAEIVDDVPTPQSDDTPPMDEKQKAHMFVLFNELGIKARETQVSGIQKIIGRTIASRNDLDYNDAAKVIASLEEHKAAAAEKSAA